MTCRPPVGMDDVMISLIMAGETQVNGSINQRVTQSRTINCGFNKLCIYDNWVHNGW